MKKNVTGRAVPPDKVMLLNGTMRESTETMRGALPQSVTDYFDR